MFECVGFSIRLVLSFYIVPGMNSVFCAVTRREYIPVDSAPASMLATVTAQNTEFIPSKLVGKLVGGNGVRFLGLVRSVR